MGQLFDRLLGSRGVQRLLAADALLTALAGLLVGLRPVVFRWLATRALGFAPGGRRLARGVGVAVLVFGVLKGSAYAVLVARARR